MVMMMMNDEWYLCFSAAGALRQAVKMSYTHGELL